jgi:hypothetical protein
MKAAARSSASPPRRPYQRRDSRTAGPVPFATYIPTGPRPAAAAGTPGGRLNHHRFKPTLSAVWRSPGGRLSDPRAADASAGRPPAPRRYRSAPGCRQPRPSGLECAGTAPGTALAAPRVHEPARFSAVTQQSTSLNRERLAVCDGWIVGYEFVVYMSSWGVRSGRAARGWWVRSYTGRTIRKSTWRS